MRRTHLVMREDQVPAASLNVKGATEVMGRDGSALHMPAWPAQPERGRPGRLAWPLPQPDQRIDRVLLARPRRIAAVLRAQPGHRLAIQARNTAEAGISSAGEIC